MDMSDNENIIIANINVTKDNLKMRIINSYENFKKEEYNQMNWASINEIENEKDIKATEIYINNEKIPFNYYHEFPSQGIYTIKYKFKSKLKSTNFLFTNCTSLQKIDLSRFNTQKIINTEYMFYGCTLLQEINFSNFTTNNVNNMQYMFYNCISLKALDLSSFVTENVANMQYMFFYCQSLKELNLDNFNTQNVVNMKCMFYYCSSLKMLNLFKFNTKNVQTMQFMFCFCKSLIKLDLSSFDTKNVDNMEYMFRGCYSLIELDLSSFDTKNVTNMGYMFCGCNSLISLDLTNFNTQNIIYKNRIFNDCNSLIFKNIKDNFYEDEKIYDFRQKFTGEIDKIIQLKNMYKFYNLPKYIKDEISTRKIKKVFTNNDFDFDLNNKFKPKIRIIAKLKNHSFNEKFHSDDNKAKTVENKIYKKNKSIKCKVKINKSNNVIDINKFIKNDLQNLDYFNSVSTTIFKKKSEKPIKIINMKSNFLCNYMKLTKKPPKYKLFIKSE